MYLSQKQFSFKQKFARLAAAKTLQNQIIKSKLGFYRYMEAVQSVSEDRQAKLDGIMETFAENCTVYTSDGLVLRGRTAVRGLYASVLEKTNDQFNPQLVEKSVAVTGDGHGISAEVHLAQINKYVGDFWYFDDQGRITELAIYSQENRK